MIIDGEYLPRGRDVWLLFDRSNGDRRTRRYCWWFDTRKDAMAHRRHQHRITNGAPLSLPVRMRQVSKVNP